MNRDLLPRDLEPDRDSIRESDQLKEEHDSSDSQRERDHDRCLKSRDTLSCVCNSRDVVSRDTMSRKILSCDTLARDGDRELVS